ncbi:MAG: DUF58 domain-containing protein [Pirellulaceae bacterium]|jgi:uncharacterized protein (DUF58 family)|nr:DUF58 domain-containing protein [Pirellulaceae bacterium]MDP7019888.1 DUF58 domain-containing protein [Pirellulaceae bacterium]
MSSERVAEILKKVQRVQLVANRAVNEMFAGQYQSVFRGRGMEFDEVREYQPGDDVRSIDWNVTARSGDCYIKQFCEERELTVLFVVDVSASGVFGSIAQAKLDLVVELTAMLMFSALKSNDKVGLLTFCNGVQEYFPPRKGKSHVLRLIRALVSVEPIAQPTLLTETLEFLNRVHKRRAVVFLLSDFLADVDLKSLRMTSRRHDLTAVTVRDRREEDWTSVGFVTLRDAETGAVLEVDTGSPAARRWFRQRSQQRDVSLTEKLGRAGVDQLVLDTAGDYQTNLRRFFRERARKAALR